MPELSATAAEISPVTLTETDRTVDVTAVRDKANMAAIYAWDLSESALQDLPALPRMDVSLPQERHVSGKDVARFWVRQYFEGTVTRVDSAHQVLFARLADLTNPSFGDEEIEIPFDEIDREDLPLASVGHLFYWFIGYEIVRTGRRRVGEIRFRRMPPLTETELAEGRRRAEETRRTLFGI
jgi:hypothetical protein